MFCPNCGKELLQDAKFCDACGAPTGLGQASSVNDAANDQSTNEQQANMGSPDIYADHPQTAPELQKPRKKGVFFKVLAIVLAAVILLAGVTVLGYYTFLPASVTLKTAQRFTVQKSWKQVDQALTRSEDKVDAFSDTPLKTDSRVSLQMDSYFLTQLGLNSSMAELLTGYLNDLGLKVTTEVDMPNKKENLNVSINYQNNPVLSLNAFLDNDRIGLSLPELSQKSITGRMSDLARLEELYPELQSVGLSSLANMDPWLSSQISQQAKVDHKDIQKLMETYGMFLVNHIDGSNMTIKRGGSTELFDEDIRCQEVTITLNQKEQLELMKDLLDTMKDDETLYNVVFSNASKVLELMAQSNPELAESMEEVDMQALLSESGIRMIFSSLKQTLTKDMFPEELVIKAYIKGLDVVKYEVEIPQATSDEKLLLSFENQINDDSSRNRISVDAVEGGNSVSVYLDFDQQYDKASDAEDFAIVFNMDLSGSFEGNIKLTLNSAADPESANVIKRNVDGTLDYDLDGETGSFSLAADVTETRNRDGLPANYDITANMSLDAPSAMPQPLSLSVAIESDIQYDVTVETPSWAESAIDLGTASKEDLDGFFSDIMQTISNAMSLLNYMF